MRTLKLKSLDNIKCWFKDLKYKVVNFDIKPATPIIPGLWAEIEQAEKAGDSVKVENNLRKILARNNTNANALLALGLIYIKSSRKREAISLLKHAIRHYPDCYEFHCLLGSIYRIYNHFGSARRAYARALSINPEATDTAYLLDAMRHKHTKSAPQEYVVRVFDGYAESFEEHLLGHLQYSAHSKVAAYLQQVLARHTQQTNLTNAVDLGCGTGLLGQELIKHFQIKNLEGVDLSPNMLQQSAAKKIYSGLHQADLTQFLHNSSSAYDLIASSDVFIYIGDLEPVFEQCARSLKPGGYLGFSLEALLWGNYKLTPSGRYRHSLRYIKSLVKKYGFSKIYHKTAHLRCERRMLVPGYLVVLQK